MYIKSITIDIIFDMTTFFMVKNVKKIRQQFRKIKSLDIIFRTCMSVKMLTQNKKRVFEENKSEYTIRSINSVIKSYLNHVQKVNTFSYQDCILILYTFIMQIRFII